MANRYAMGLLIFLVIPALSARGGLVGPDHAWFTLAGGDCSGASVISEGPGEALVIEKDAGPSCLLRIGYRLDATINGMPVPLENWGFTLDGGDPDLSVPSPSGAGLDWLGTGYTLNLGTPGLNGSLLWNFGQRTTGANGSTGLVGILELVIEKDGVAATHDIFGRIGTLGQNLGSGDVWVGSVGPNEVITADPDTPFGSLPVITIRNVPEPATMLLFIPVLAMGISRRR